MATVFPHSQFHSWFLDPGSVDYVCMLLTISSSTETLAYQKSHFTVFISSFSRSYDQISSKKQLRERGLFWPSSRGYSPLQQEGMGAGMGDRCSYWVHRQSGETDAGTQLTFPFSSSRATQPMKWCHPKLGWDFSSQSRQSLIDVSIIKIH